MPRSLMCFRVSGDTGTMEGPVPRIRRSRQGVSKAVGTWYLKQRCFQTHQAWATRRLADPSCVQPPPIDPSCCAQCAFADCALLSALPDPRLPVEGIATNKQDSRSSNLEARIESEAIVCASVNGSCRGGRSTEHIHGSKVGLSVFFAGRAAILCLWRTYWASLGCHCPRRCVQVSA
jgi:hypothetical protein